MCRSILNLLSFLFFKLISYADAIDSPSVLNQFIMNKFGQGRGALLSPVGQLQTIGMDYIPKYVLNDAQINGLVAGLFAHIDGKIKVSP
jgi:hypothetical protein